MTAQPPDPDPAQTPDLEPGGGVAARVDSTGFGADIRPLGARTKPHVRKFSPAVIVSLVAIAVFVLLFASTALVLIWR